MPVALWMAFATASRRRRVDVLPEQGEALALPDIAEIAHDGHKFAAAVEVNDDVAVVLVIEYHVLYRSGESYCRFPIQNLITAPLCCKS